MATQRPRSAAQRDGKGGLELQSRRVSVSPATALGQWWPQAEENPYAGPVVTGGNGGSATISMVLGQRPSEDELGG